MKIRDILRTKGTDVVTIGPDTGVPEAMRLLVSHNIGALVVLDGGKIAGILSERDVLRAGAESLERLRTERVRDLMTPLVITATPDDEIAGVMDTLTERRIRHLPVVQGEQLAGMLSIGDVVNALRKDAEDENHFLHAYIEGTPM